MVGDFQVSRAGWIGDYEDPNTFLDLMRPNRGNNKTGWENYEFDNLIMILFQMPDARRHNLVSINIQLSA